MPPSRSRSQIIQDLRRRLGPAQPVEAGEAVSTGIEALDGLLPSGGLQRGTLVEWLADGEGCGAGTLALLAGLQVVRSGGGLVVVDPQQEFHPPAAAAWGVDLEETVVVRPRSPADTLWTLEQTLRSPGVAVAWCQLGKEHHRNLRRLRLAAEAGGGIGMLVRPAEVRSLPGWADVRLLVKPVSSQSPGWRLRIELLRHRKGTSGGTVDVDICHETGLVHPAARVAPPASSRRTAGA